MGRGEIFKKRDMVGRERAGRTVLRTRRKERTYRVYGQDSRSYGGTGEALGQGDSHGPGCMNLGGLAPRDPDAAGCRKGSTTRPTLSASSRPERHSPENKLVPSSAIRAMRSRLTRSRWDGRNPRRGRSWKREKGKRPISVGALMMEAWLSVVGGGKRDGGSSMAIAGPHWPKLRSGRDRDVLAYSVRVLGRKGLLWCKRPLPRPGKPSGVDMHQGRVDLWSRTKSGTRLLHVRDWRAVLSSKEPRRCSSTNGPLVCLSATEGRWLRTVFTTELWPEEAQNNDDMSSIASSSMALAAQHVVPLWQRVGPRLKTPVQPSLRPLSVLPFGPQTSRVANVGSPEKLGEMGEMGENVDAKPSRRGALDVNSGIRMMPLRLHLRASVWQCLHRAGLGQNHLCPLKTTHSREDPN
ncbi:hypothetical protein BJ875DRAFT_539259 [Amylocarpus encephaloides]|uniref:Uncharacterized protein n=1 Tax=Amylocarpus encephaloides TaxID=45428 RepID=A0A9P7YT70_9HELO|nr:hypothetical protein BJ875DRAFT_539259 [Amylocarpus encephaloides]